MKLFKDVIFPTASCEPRVTPEAYKAVQSLPAERADPKQAAEEGSQRIESFLSGIRGVPLMIQAPIRQGQGQLPLSLARARLRFMHE
jgi:hypothetical protein